MRITFVAIGCEQLAISLMSAIAKQEGHQVGLAFSASLFQDRYNMSVPRLAPYFDDRQEVIKAIKEQNPDVLAFSVLTGTYQWMLGIAQEAKKINPNIKIIFGGVHVSAVPDRVLARPEIDFVIVGEGDVAFAEILKGLSKGGPTEPIPNTRYKLANGQVVRGPQTGFIQDLNALPIFDKTLWEEHIRVGDLYLTMASRGCPYRCTFCFNNFFAKLPEGKKGKYVRQRSVEHMLHELRIAKKRYKLRVVDFLDDVFTVDKDWVKDFVYKFKQEIGVPYQCLVHPKYIDEDVARWLSDTGCTYVQMGIQTMDDEFKFTTIKRYEKSDNVQKALDIMRKYKLRAKCDHMFGLPGEPEGAQDQALKLFIDHPPYRIATFWTNLLPGTELVDQAKSMNLINDADIDRLNDGLDFDFFRTTNNIQDPKKRKRFKAYETIYKLIPLSPLWLRRKYSPKLFERIPTGVLSLFTFAIDTLSGLMTNNPGHRAYALHYFFSMKRFFARKWGWKVEPLTKPIDNEPVSYLPPLQNKSQDINSQEEALIQN